MSVTVNELNESRSLFRGLGRSIAGKVLTDTHLHKLEMCSSVNDMITLESFLLVPFHDDHGSKKDSFPPLSLLVVTLAVC